MEPGSLWFRISSAKWRLWWGECNFSEHRTSAGQFWGEIQLQYSALKGKSSKWDRRFMVQGLQFLLKLSMITISSHSVKVKAWNSHQCMFVSQTWGFKPHFSGWGTGSEPGPQFLCFAAISLILGSSSKEESSGLAWGLFGEPRRLCRLRRWY